MSGLNMKYDKDYNKVYNNVDEFIKDNISGLPNEYHLAEIYNKLSDVYFYDSKSETLEHIKRVSQLLGQCSIELIKRSSIHDNSKLESPEKEGFDKMTPILKDLVFGSPEYTASLKELEVSLNHHYSNNSHHPQHYKNGIDGMDLFDIIEMFMDWKAASERNKHGDIYTSIGFNKSRFNITDQLCNIFTNTANKLGW